MTTHRTTKRRAEWMHVRCTGYTGPNLGLVLHPHDNANDRFVLTHGGPRPIPPLGWITGSDGQQAKYRVELPSGQSCFFVPFDELEPADALMILSVHRLPDYQIDCGPYQSWPYGGPHIGECNFDVNEFYAIRKAEGLKIELETATVIYKYVPTLDPYFIDEPPARVSQWGRQYFARARGEEMWVSFYDLPADTRFVLWSCYCEEAAQSEPGGSR